MDTPSFPLEDGNLDLTLPLLFYDFTSTQLQIAITLIFFFGDICMFRFRSPISYEDQYTVNAKVVCSRSLILAVVTNLLNC